MSVKFDLELHVYEARRLIYEDAAATIHELGVASTTGGEKATFR